LKLRFSACLSIGLKFRLAEKWDWVKSELFATAEIRRMAE